MSNKHPVTRFKKGDTPIIVRQPKFKPINRLPTNSPGQNIMIITPEIIEDWFKNA